MIQDNFEQHAATKAVVGEAAQWLKDGTVCMVTLWNNVPIVVTPPVVVAGIGGIFSKKWAKTWLPLCAGIYTLNGVIGEYYHARGVARKPGGWRMASYNVPMGPPIMAPGLMTIVGGMGLLAAVLRRER